MRLQQIESKREESRKMEKRLNSKTQHQSISSMLLLLLNIAALLLLCHLQASTRVEARYLPTRSDSKDVEALKDLIGQVMNRAMLEEMEARFAQKLEKAGASEQRYILHKMFADRVDRRSGETPVDSPGDMFRETRGSKKLIDRR